MNALVDLWKVKGLVVKDPYIPLCVPISVENPALAYDDVNDRFKVDIEEISYGSIPISLSDSWTRILGQIDLSRLSGSAISHSNPLLVRLSNGTTWIDPRYPLGNQDQTLRQRTGTYELLVQLFNAGVEIDPRAIRALTATDVVSAIKSGTWNIDNLLNPHPVSLASIPNPSNLDIAISLLARETTLGTIHGHVDSIDGKITACNTGNVTIGSALPAGTNAIGKLAANSGIDIGDVDVLSIPEVTQDTRTALKMQPEREDLTSLGGVASPSAAGVQIVAPDGTKKPKVYDCEYEVLAAGLHYFYFGTTTTATTKRFLTRQTVGVNSKSFVQPRVGEAGDGIYLYSAVAETNMPYDLGYVLE